MNIQDLSPELLIEIFSNLDIRDLHYLRITSKRFKEFIDTHQHIILKDKVPLVTNQLSNIFRERCAYHLTGFKKMRVAKNWIDGRYREKVYLKIKNDPVTNLCITNEHVWISRNENIFRHKRCLISNDRTLSSDDSLQSFELHNILKDVPDKTIIGQRPVSKEIQLINDFQVKSDRLICAYGDGHMFLLNLENNEKIFDVPNCHNAPIHSVDISEDRRVIVSGSRDSRTDHLSIWNVYEKNQDTNNSNVLELKQRNKLPSNVWALSLQRNAPVFAFAIAGTVRHCLYIYDLEKMTYRFIHSRNGKGTMDMKWEDANTLWTCGFDTCLRRWDIRTNGCVQFFPDPIIIPTCCLDLDYCNTIVTGSQQHGRVTLWDTRQTKFVQLYYMMRDEELASSLAPKRLSSPIHRVAFDSQHLFAATNQSLNVLDFSAHDAFSRNYS